MLDDEQANLYFDVEGNFRDQVDFERFVEGYRPLWSYHPDEIDDYANTYNVDLELIDEVPLDSRRVLAKYDFEQLYSQHWYSYGSTKSNQHPDRCTCPDCIFEDYDGDLSNESQNTQGYNDEDVCAGCGKLVGNKALARCRCGAQVWKDCHFVHCFDMSDTGETTSESSSHLLDTNRLETINQPSTGNVGVGENAIKHTLITMNIRSSESSTKPSSLIRDAQRLSHEFTDVDAPKLPKRNARIFLRRLLHRMLPWHRKRR